MICRYVKDFQGVYYIRCTRWLEKVPLIFCDESHGRIREESPETNKRLALTNPPGNSLWHFFGTIKWPFQWLSELQQGVIKVTNSITWQVYMFFEPQVLFSCVQALGRDSLEFRTQKILRTTGQIAKTTTHTVKSWIYNKPTYRYPGMSRYVLIGWCEPTPPCCDPLLLI